MLRKALHVTTLVIPVAYASGLAQPVVVTLLAGAVAVAGVVEVARRRSSTWRLRFEALCGPLLRTREHQEVVGATWLFVGFFGVAMLAPKAAAIAAMCAVSAGDAAASMVGRSVGRVRLGPRKTLEGTLAGFGVTLLAAIGIAQMPMAVAGLVAAAAMLAELPEGPGDDNVRVVVVAAVVGTLASHWMA
jgi:dolichol kinase